MLPFDKSRCRESILEIYQKWGQGKMKHEKPELSRKNPYRLPKYRYLELKNFCFQYNDWKRALARLDGWRAQEGDMGGIVKSNVPSDPTAREGTLRAYYSQHIELIDCCMKNRPTSGRTTTARYTAVTIRSIVFRPFTWNGTRDYASSNSATTRKPKRPTGGLSTRG